jgi:hypothetical protein
MVSEEEKEIILVDEDDCGPYVVCFDPLGKKIYYFKTVKIIKLLRFFKY